MMAKIIIEVEFSSPSEAAITLRALSPDNTPLPKNMKFEMKSDENRLIVLLEYNGKISTLLSTLDDILASMKIVGDVVTLSGET
ncbi:MAG: KEOPS complex subunit Pcc1 [Candidatus Jordarchaeales archaeon]